MNRDGDHWTRYHTYPPRTRQCTRQCRNVRSSFSTLTESNTPARTLYEPSNAHSRIPRTNFFLQDPNELETRVLHRQQHPICTSWTVCNACRCCSSIRTSSMPFLQIQYLPFPHDQQRGCRFTTHHRHLLFRSKPQMQRLTQESFWSTQQHFGKPTWCCSVAPYLKSIMKQTHHQKRILHYTTS